MNTFGFLHPFECEHNGGLHILQNDNIFIPPFDNICISDNS